MLYNRYLKSVYKDDILVEQCVIRLPIDGFEYNQKIQQMKDDLQPNEHLHIQKIKFYVNPYDDFIIRPQV